jgi:hypothetical protein
MMIPHSDTRKLKYAALFWLRIDQRCPFIATEVGEFLADCIGINAKKMIEIEVKVSLADLKKDATKPKHYFYRKGYDGNWIPNYFYYAVPPDLVEAAKAEVEAKHDNLYGVMAVDQSCSVVKRSARLREAVPSDKAKMTCALRMGSELIRFHEAWV